MFDWPHAPPHRLDGNGTYFITGATYLKRHYYRRSDDLNRFLSLLFALAGNAKLSLQAWSVFSNHYHLVAQGAGLAMRAMLAELHSIAARELNARDAAAGRKVWFQFRDTELTYERSWLARLKYTHQNPVKHGLVTNARDYPWCSAGWFERVSNPAFVRTLDRFGLDRIHVSDDFEVAPPLHD
jgi:putative transposase